MLLSINHVLVYLVDSALAIKPLVVKYITLLYAYSIFCCHLFIPVVCYSHSYICFRAQITAYRSLARNQPLNQQIALMAAGKRTGDTPPECPTPPAQPYGEGQGPPPMSGAGPAGGKPGVSGAVGDPSRGGGGAPPTPLPMTAQMAPPTQLTPPLVNPVSFIPFLHRLA